MEQLRQDYKAFVARDTIIVAIGPDNVKDFSNYFQEHKLPFIGLPDEKHKIPDVFGQEVRLLKLGRMPAQMIIDKHGLLRYIHYGHSMQDIPNNAEILDFLDDIQRES
jgi:peroxiredoxin